MKRFACGSIIPDCDWVFTGLGDQSVLDRALEHAATDHGMAAAPLPFIELVLTHTRPVPSTTNRGHLRLVDLNKATSVVANGRYARSAAAVLERPDVAPPCRPVRRPGADVDDQALATVRQLHRPERGRQRPSEAHHTYRHECLLYAGTGGFLQAVVPFVRDGLSRRESLLVAVAQPRLGALRSALAGDAEQVMFADMAVLGHNPAQIIPAWRQFIARQGGAGRPVRGISEPIWATRPPEVIVEAQQHEALLNVAVSPDTPLWLLCPYDTVALDEPTIVEAMRSHPVIAQSNTHRGSTRYEGAEHVRQLSSAPLPEPGVGGTPVTFDSDLQCRIDEILAIAANAGLRIDRAVKLAAAVHEVAAAADRGNSEMVVRVWSERAALVCEVIDPDAVHDPLTRFRAGDFSAGNRAVRLANEMCDLVQVRSGPAGTRIRIRCWL